MKDLEKERKEYLTKKLPLKLDIQMFAEGDDGKGGDDPNPPQPKTYSEEEYKKMKDAFDKASSELAEAKKKEKAKMSEEEKKKAELEEKDKKFSDMEKELTMLKMEKTLSKTFDEKTTKEVSEAIVTSDTEKLVDLIFKSQEEFRKRVMEEAKAEFSKKGKIPGASDSGSDGDNSKIAELAKKKSTKVESKTDAWDKYKNR